MKPKDLTLDSSSAMPSAMVTRQFVTYLSETGSQSGNAERTDPASIQKLWAEAAVQYHINQWVASQESSWLMVYVTKCSGVASGLLVGKVGCVWPIFNLLMGIYLSSIVLGDRW